MKKNMAIFLSTLLFASVLLMTNAPANAQTTYTNLQEGGSIQLPAGVTPDATVDTTSFLSFRPNPVGVGQTVLVNIWLNPATHVSRYLTDFKVTITKPDGSVETKILDSYRADATAWFEFVADQGGEWKLKFEFPGAYYPPGNYTVLQGAFMAPQVVSFEESCYYKPSETKEQTLIVQEDQVYSWPPSTLPTDYWSRPVSPENREWWPILGNYPADGIVGGGPDWPAETNVYMNPRYCFTPYVQAPNTAHVVWLKQDNIGGLVGGTWGPQSLTGGGNTPSIIYAGRCYDTVTKVFDGETRTVWQCYDLRTGEVYWEKTDVTQVPTLISYAAEAAGTVVADTGAYLGNQKIELMYVGGGRVIRYNPWDGSVTFNMSIAPLTTGTYYSNGPYFYTVQTLGSGSNRSYRLLNWTLKGEHTGTGYQYTYSLDILGNVSWPWSNLGTAYDLETGIAATTTAINPSAIGAYYGTRISAADMKTGGLIWEKTVEDTMYSGSCTVADHGKVAALMMGGYYLAFDLRTGNLAWKGEAMDYPWSEPAFGAYSVQSAYGMFYRQAYDGVYAFNWDDGSIAWKYTAPAVGYETPYTDENGTSVYSFNSGGIIADGKMYVSNTEHTPSQPITRGWRLHCIDAFTGEGIWNITGSMSPGAVADGYLTVSNSYDGRMYVIGKGKSETTISAPQVAITLGQSIMLTGSVLDQSPAQSGTPCVSKDSMGPWMEYLHMQKPIPTDVTGVPISIDAVDPNGNAIHIATVTSDMSGTFGYLWQPEITGEYVITATFMGDDSYGSSWAETHVGVVEAPQETTPTQTPLTMPPFELYTIGTGVAVIIAIAIAVLLLRKRP